MAKDFSREYGTALYQLAVEEKTSKEIFDDFQRVSEVFSQNPEFGRLLSNPRLSARERAVTVGKVFDGKINRSLLNALKILAEKRRCDTVSKCCEVYKRLYCEDNGILPVTATSAVALSDAQKKRLTERLKENTGSDILLSCKVDPRCIGGIRLEYGGKRYDASVRGRLSDLARQIKNSDQLYTENNL